jgi:hypothetical protein
MPRRPATVERDIPLCLIPHIVPRGVGTHGEELERVVVRRAHFHFSTVSIRSRPIKREFKRVKKYPSGITEADTGEGGEDTESREGGEDRVDKEDTESRKSWENTNGREVRVDTGEQGRWGKNRETQGERI